MTPSDPDDTAPRPANSWRKPLAVYNLRPRIRALQWISIVIGLIGVLAALGGGIWRWTLAFTHYGPAVVWRWSLPWFLAAIGLAPALILGLYSVWRSRRLMVALFPSGLVLHRGRKKIELPWQEIQSLNLLNAWQAIPLLRSTRPRVLEIITREGQHLRLTSELEKFEALIENIKAKVYPRMYRALAGSFNQGKTLSFGALSLSPNGILHRGSTIPWNQVQSAELKKGRLLVEGRDKTLLKIPAPKIPNTDLCLQMIESMVHSS